MRLTADLSTETLWARKESQDILKVMIGKNIQSRITLFSKDFIQNQQRNLKKITDKQKLREFSTTKLALQQMLRELL